MQTTLIDPPDGMGRHKINIHLAGNGVCIAALVNICANIWDY